MKNNGVLVTKELHDSYEIKFNDQISSSIEQRDELLSKFDDISYNCSVSKEAYKLSRKEYKEAIKLAKRDLKHKITLAKKEYDDAANRAYIPVNDAEAKYVAMKLKKKRANQNLNKIRSKIAKLKSYKMILEKKYTSEKEEYIDINKFSKIL